MKSRRNDFVLGLTTIALAALFLATFFFLYPSLGGAGTRITVQFSHRDGVAPLKAGGQVLLSGALPVGTITAVRTEERPAEKPRTGTELLIVVDAELEPGFTLYSGCEITSDQPMVGGAGYLVIRSVGTPGEPLDTDKPLRGLPPQSMVAAISTLSERLLGPQGMVDKLEAMIDQDREGSLTYKLALSLDDINAMTAQLRSELDPHDRQALMAKLHGVLENINGMTAALRAQTALDDDDTMMVKLHAALDRMAEMLSEATVLIQENRPAVRNTLVSVENLSRSLEQDTLAALQAELVRDDPNSMLGKIHVSMDRLNASLADVQTLTDESRRMIVANRPGLDRTLENVKEMSEQLRLASVEIRLTPWRLMYRPTARETAEFDLFEAARTFAEAATYLDDAAARLEAVVQAEPAGGRTPAADAEIRSIQESLKAAFERFDRAESFLWERMK